MNSHGTHGKHGRHRLRHGAALCACAAMNAFVFSVCSVAILLPMSGTAWGHHTRDHLVLGQDAGEVIAATRQGGQGWLLWGGLALLLFLGLVRWWVGRSRR